MVGTQPDNFVLSIISLATYLFHVHMTKVPHQPARLGMYLPGSCHDLRGWRIGTSEMTTWKMTGSGCLHVPRRFWVTFRRDNLDAYHGDQEAEGREKRSGKGDEVVAAGGTGCKPIDVPHTGCALAAVLGAQLSTMYLGSWPCGHCGAFQLYTLGACLSLFWPVAWIVSLRGKYTVYLGTSETPRKTAILQEPGELPVNCIVMYLDPIIRPNPRQHFS